MPTTKTVTLYTYDELSDEAKEKAKEWYRQGQEFDHEPVYADAHRAAKILGIDIYRIHYSGFWSQGDGACFEGRYVYQKGAAKEIRRYAPQDAELHRIGNELQRIQKQAFYALRASCEHRGRYYHSGCMRVKAWDSRDDHFTVREDLADDLEQALRDFADWIYKQLEIYYDFDNSDECVEESIRINEYTFTKDGKRED